MESEAGGWESRALGALVRTPSFNLKWKPLEDFEQGNAYDLIFVFKKMALASVGRRNVLGGMPHYKSKNFMEDIIVPG